MIRACAGLLVVACHVFAPICAGMNDYSTANWWFFNLFDSVIRPCASLYVMISGALFLGSSREEQYFEFIRRRTSKIVVPFFAWSMIYAVMESRMREEPFSFGGAILQFLQGPTEYHLWFMYLILGLYLVTPFVRRFVQHARPSELQGVLALWLGFLTLEFLFPEMGGSGPGGTLLNYSGFFILGYVLDKTYISDSKLNGVILFWVVNVLVCAAATYVLTLGHGGELDEKFYGGATPLVALQAGAVFLMLKRADSLPFFQRDWPRAIITRLGRESYNVYLMHAFFIWVLTKGFLGFALSHDTGFSPVFGVALTTVAVLGCSLGLTFLLKKIPVVSKLFVLS